MRTKSTSLRSFDGTETVLATVARPEQYRDLSAAMALGSPIIARGAGLSYSSASMGQGAISIDMTRFDRVLAFDPATGAVDVEPGIRVGALTDFLVARGFHLPVLPGYPSITVGGCVAFNVHGKSQFHSGNFGEWTRAIQLLHPDHGEIVCSRESHSDVFDLTVGGFGLTGVMTKVSLKTAPLPGAAIEIEPVRTRDLHEAADLMQARAADVSCLYSWHNLNRSNSAFGAGVVYLERFVPGPANGAKKGAMMSIETRFPVPIWNRMMTPLTLATYEFLQRRARARVSALRPAIFPIEGLEVYYAGFGARGFREYQLIVAVPRWHDFVSALQRLVESARVPVTLASLKLFKGEGRYLSFAGAGICLAIDVPAHPKSLELFGALDRLSAEYGACINLSKDSRVGADACRRLFPEYERFKSDLSRFDPKRRCQSRLRELTGV